MTLTATIETRNGTPWLTIQSPLGVLHRDQIDTHNRAAQKLSIDWAHTKTGIDRNLIYDALRLHQWKQRHD
jgi:hypothetical protein